MDEDGIRSVLARASELRSKITNCIQNSSSTSIVNGIQENEEEEDDSLLNISDALQSLESQLSSLQDLQQQQWYEKEAYLAEIDHSRKKLLQKLKEYKGDNNLEVIHEATTFASSTVEFENGDLILPPYQIPHSSESLSHFKHKLSQNGVMDNHSTHETEETNHQLEPRGPIKGWRQVIGATAKMVITLVGFIAVFSLSGFEPRVGKSEDKRGVMFGCPPGKVLVVENGEARCLVKERVEIPFVSVATTPNVNYGCG